MKVFIIVQEKKITVLNFGNEKLNEKQAVKPNGDLCANVNVNEFIWFLI